MKESKQVREWTEPWPYWNQRQNSYWEPGLHLTCLEFFRGIQEYCKAPWRFSCKKSSEFQTSVYSSAHRPSHKESTHLHSEFGPWLSQIPPFLRWGRSLKSNALCVITICRVLWMQLKALLWKTAMLSLFHDFQFCARLHIWIRWWMRAE